MRIMGLSDLAYWASWLLYYTIVQVIIATVCLVIITYGGVLVHSSKTIIWLIFYAYGLKNFAWIVFVQAFFTNPKNAAIFASLMPAFGGLINSGVSSDLFPKFAVRLASLVPTVTLIRIIKTLTYYEQIELGVHFNQWHDEHLHFSVRNGILYLTTQFCVILVTGLYLDAVKVTDGGRRKSLCFCLRPSYWRKQEVMNSQIDDRTTFETTYMDSYFYEPAGDDYKEGVVIQDIRKVCKNGFVSVDRINLNLESDQIFVLLGHNGAGKTSLINMLTGMTSITDGQATIFGKDVRTQIEQVRQNLGVCLQQDVFYDLLTPQEQLQLCYDLKGMPLSGRDAEINKLIDDIGLSDKRDSLSGQLSGGNKRKLSVAIAVCGGSKLIILDEPSSGLDIQARRELWTLLLKYRKDRVILLTTHYMDEAEFLSHRIAILDSGKVRALGSPVFLKNAFGCGYNLKLDVNQDYSLDALDYVRGFFGNDIQVSFETKHQLQLVIPSHFQHLFGDFFNALDRDMETIGVDGYGISQASLTDVFEKHRTLPTKQNDQENPQIDATCDQNEALPLAPISHRNISTETVEPIKIRSNLAQNIFIRSLKALMIQKSIVLKRDRRSLAIDFLVPSLIMLLTVALTKVNFWPRSDPVHIATSLLPQPCHISINQEPISQSDVSIQNDLAPLFAISDVKLNATLPSGTFSEFATAANALRFSQENNYGAYQIFKSDRETQQHQFINFVNLTSSHVTSYLPQFMYEALLQIATKDPSLRFTTTSRTFPPTYTLKNQTKHIITSLIVLNTTIAFSIIITVIVGGAVSQRVSGLKHYQSLSGMNLLAYWITNALFDLAKLEFTAVVSIVLFSIFELDYSAAWLPFLLFPFAIVPFSYVISFAFSDESTAQTISFGMHFFAMCLMAMVVQGLQLMSGLSKAGRLLGHAMKIIPSYCLTQAIYSDGGLDSFIQDHTPQTAMVDDLWSLEKIGSDVSALSLHTLFWTIILCLIESNQFKGYFKDRKNGQINVQPQTADALEEQRQIQKALSQHHMIKVDKLSKIYDRGPCSKATVAIEQLSFGIGRGDCLTFLGVNGAGKSTTFKILTGEIKPTKGDVQIAGYDVAKGFDRLKLLIGYCPQQNPVYPYMTVLEHLKFYARLKGIADQEIDQEIDSHVKDLDLSLQRQKQACQLSGGNLKKLTLAIALLGRPQIVLLDEPTAEMDPLTCKFIWHHLKSLIQQNSCILLTTHSAEEAENLSTKVAIVTTGGNLKAIGSPQKLLNQYSNDLIIEVKLTVKDSASNLETQNGQTDQIKDCRDEVINQLLILCSQVDLLETHDVFFKLRVLRETVALGDLCRCMEQIKSKFNLAYYSISRPGLSEIFQSYTKTQELVVQRFTQSQLI